MAELVNLDEMKAEFLSFAIEPITGIHHSKTHGNKKAKNASVSL